MGWWTIVTSEQLQRERNYGISMSIVKSMLNKGILTPQEYKKIDTIMTKKYEPILGGLQV
jgi:hypothetical protein